MGGISAALLWLDLAGRELLLFAGVWFSVGLLDELAIDLLWLAMKLLGRGRASPFCTAPGSPLRGPAAVLIPCWHEAGVIGQMIASCRTAWPHRDCAFYIGTYRNDAPTRAAATQAAQDDPRMRVIVVDRDGPTTKADCLNALYDAMAADEAKGTPFRFVLLHDAEDRMHPLALDLIDDELERADFVQLPVVPEIDRRSRWVAGHYADEFADSHGRALVVRDWLRVSLPAAGVGCAFRRELLSQIAELRGAAHPFAAECLTEDYELGLLVQELGGRSRFVRALDSDGRLIATREFFPDTIAAAVRQKARWIHGIAFQGWDRLGWSGNPLETWMRLRDRRGPLTAIVLFAAYLVILIWAVLAAGRSLGAFERPPYTALLQAVVLVATVGSVWRALLRSAFTAAHYGWREGLRAIPRTVIANVITIIAARRALTGYLRAMQGSEPAWDKTHHRSYPPPPSPRGPLRA